MFEHTISHKLAILVASMDSPHSFSPQGLAVIRHPKKINLLLDFCPKCWSWTWHCPNSISRKPILFFLIKLIPSKIFWQHLKGHSFFSAACENKQQVPFFFYGLWVNLEIWFFSAKSSFQPLTGKANKTILWDLFLIFSPSEVLSTLRVHGFHESLQQ